MTNTEMKKWRTIQIAATILYRICGKIRIEKLPNNDIGFVSAKQI